VVRVPCVLPALLLAAAPAAAEGAAARAAAWLWQQQGADGGWHSETYGLLRSGQALTPFVLHALLESGRPAPPGAVAKALDFLRANLDDRGVLGVADPDVLEYPNYATAYALLCFVRENDPRDRARIALMRAHLAGQQYREANGFEPDALAYGGWGFGGEYPRGHAGHMDLAHTRRVLQALRAAGVADERLYARARSFLMLLQRHPKAGRPQPEVRLPVEGAGDAFDGGFYLTPVVFGANKGLGFRARDGRAYYRSYATATCDGLLALLAAGVPRDDPRVRAAAGWLERHARVDVPEGIPDDQPTPWREAVRFYHLAVRAEACRALDRPGDAIARVLAKEQRDDGSFASGSALMKEDDPLVATALALVALGSCPTSVVQAPTR